MTEPITEPKAEPIATPVEPKVEPQHQPDDLLSRVSKFTAEHATTNDPNKKPTDNGSDKFDSAELKAAIDNIQDPNVKSQMEGLRKSLLSGVNHKFEEIATLRKEMQSFMEGNRKNGDKWTPQRVQELANDPEFVRAAQQVAQVSDEADDPLEYLDDGTKKYVKGLEAKISKLENISNQAWENQNRALREQQHRELQARYGDYNPQKIDEITKEMLEGKIQATNEHIYKAFNYDTAVNKAYELGRKDEREGVQTKMQSSSADGLQTVQPNMKIEPQKGESSSSFFNRIIEKNLRMAKAKG